MTVLRWALVGLPVLVFLYAYVGYPAMLALLARFRPKPRPDSEPGDWPLVSISLPAYNEEASISGTLDAILAADYPADRLQVVVISDASTDRTDEIVSGYSHRGVELVRVTARGGKTAAEEAGVPHLQGQIVVNTDASVRILPGSLKPLVGALQDPRVGVASGRDVSVAPAGANANRGEASYVGYEMWVRRLETRLGGIVGASGCFYAIRRHLHRQPLPAALSRDFAAALVAEEHGFRSVSVDDGICLVPRAASLEAEFRRKARTMIRGLNTLWFKRHLLNPRRHGSFAWKLFSHKLCRWLVVPTLPLGVVGCILWSRDSRVAVGVLALGAAAILMGLVGLRWPRGRKRPRVLEAAGYVVVAGAASLLAWTQAVRGEPIPAWEPTRRIRHVTGSERRRAGRGAGSGPRSR